MGKIIGLVQRSKKWHDYRSSRIGASETSIILGSSPFKTPYQLWEEKLYRKSVQLTSSMKRGIDREDEALKWAEKELDTILCPRVVEHDIYPWKFASLDGLSPDGKIALEIKWANSVVHTLARKGEVINYYAHQLQSQMACCNLDHIYFLSCFEVPGSGSDFLLIKVRRDDAFIESIIDEESIWYQKHLVEMCPPELCDRDYEHVQDNLHYDYVCCEYLRICKEITTLEKEKKVYFDTAISLSKGINSKSNSFKSTKFQVKGNVDYGSIPELENVDLDKYRKEPREQWKVSKI